MNKTLRAISLGQAWIAMSAEGSPGSGRYVLGGLSFCALLVVIGGSHEIATLLEAQFQPP
jgi:hypothetical protein